MHKETNKKTDNKISKSDNKIADKKQIFILPDLNVRGVIINLADSWQEILSRRDYPNDIVDLLGQFSVASLLVSSNIKFAGKITMQLQSHAALELLVSQVSNNNTFRSLAQYKKSITGDIVADTNSEGVIAISVEYAKNKQPYQGLVSVVYNDLAKNLENYYEKSEQLTTLIRLAADRQNAAGILLQRLPATPDNPLVISDEELARLTFLLDTFDLKELAQVGNQTMLSRLFAEDDIEVFPEQDLSFDCGCSAEATLIMLGNLPQDDIDDIITKKENIEINCEFCGKVYRHSHLMLADLVAAKIAGKNNMLH